MWAVCVCTLMCGLFGFIMVDCVDYDGKSLSANAGSWEFWLLEW